MAASSRPNTTKPNQLFTRPPQARRPDRAVMERNSMVRVRAQRRRHGVRRFLSGD